MELWRQFVLNLPGSVVCWEYTEPCVNAKMDRCRSALVNICEPKQLFHVTGLAAFGAVH